MSLPWGDPKTEHDPKIPSGERADLQIPREELSTPMVLQQLRCS